MKVYVRAPYPEKRLAELKELFEEVVYEPWTETGERYYEDEMLENLKRVEPDALITELDRVTEKVLNGYGKLRFIGDYRMLVYAIVLIIVMLMNWAPKAQEYKQMIAYKFKSKFGKNKEEAAE